MAVGRLYAIGAALVAGCVAVSGCAPMSAPVPFEKALTARGENPGRAAQNFVAAVARMEPVAERTCRRIDIARRCDFLIVVDDRPGQQPNAFQMLAPDGRPILGFTLGLIAQADNTDEIAFVMGHEASHHILGHIPQTEASAREGALLAGMLVAVGGGDAAEVRRAQKVGASVGARRFSKAFELQADELGSIITQEAGFSAVRGAQFFNRIPDPGNRFLGTHPPNARRLAVVRETVDGLARGKVPAF